MVGNIDWEERIITAVTNASADRQSKRQATLDKAAGLFAPALEIAKNAKNQVDKVDGFGIGIEDLTMNDGGLADARICLQKPGAGATIDFRLGSADPDRIIIHGLDETIARGFFPPLVDKPQFTALQIADAVAETIERFFAN
jgi:hypothetical protein